jgi:hypothetical protein
MPDDLAPLDKVCRNGFAAAKAREQDCPVMLACRVRAVQPEVTKSNTVGPAPGAQLCRNPVAEGPLVALTLNVRCPDRTLGRPMADLNRDVAGSRDPFRPFHLVVTPRESRRASRAEHPLNRAQRKIKHGD